jgi:RNA polymerase sigma-70 factor (ECF subfamily)
MPGNDREERLLVEQCLRGNQRAWEKLFKGHHRLVRSIAGWNKWSFTQHETEDVVQEIVEQVVKSLRGFQFQSRLSTFIYKIAVNTCVAQLRKKTALKRRSDLDCVALDTVGNGDQESETLVPVAGGKNQEEVLLDRENVQVIRKVLGSLDERCKELIRFRFFEDLSFEQIAAKLEAKRNTLVVRLKRCLDRLFKRLQTVK